MFTNGTSADAPVIFAQAIAGATNLLSRVHEKSVAMSLSSRQAPSGRLYYTRSDVNIDGLDLGVSSPHAISHNIPQCTITM